MYELLFLLSLGFVIQRGILPNEIYVLLLYQSEKFDLVLHE